MRKRIGSCSICGGDVMAYTGAWFSVNPPPPPECSKCGATTSDDVIDMTPLKQRSLLKSRREISND